MKAVENMAHVLHSMITSNHRILNLSTSFFFPVDRTFHFGASMGAKPTASEKKYLLINSRLE